MSELEQFYEKTIALIKVLGSSSLERDDKISQAEQLFDDRDQLLAGISTPASEHEKELAKKTIELNEKLATLLEREKLFIQKDIRDLQHKKESSTKYANPYKNLAGQDGVYYDKRN